jgi:phage terminase small subunit
MALNDRQKKFVQEYLIDHNAGEAYRRAGYKVTTYSSAHAAGSRLLKTVKIQKAIVAAQARLAVRTELTQDYVIGRLCIEAETTGKFSSPQARVKAVELLGRHLGMFPLEHKHSGLLQLEMVETLVRSRSEAKALLPNLVEAGTVPGRNGTG